MKKLYKKEIKKYFNKNGYYIEGETEDIAYATNIKIKVNKNDNSKYFIIHFMTWEELYNKKDMVVLAMSSKKENGELMI